MSQRSQSQSGTKRTDAVPPPSAPSDGRGAQAGTGRAGAAAPRTFEALLRHMVELAQAILPEQRRTASTAERDRSRALVRERPLSGLTAQQTMTQALERLRPEVALKLRTLMVAGRDGRRITDVQTNLTIGDADSAFAIAARDLSENGPLLVDYLRRGHAMACASGLDIEGPFAQWAAVAPRRLLEERAWLSFGRELAMSQPADWKCLAIFLPSDAGEALAQLYLRRGELAWWSFENLLERPSVATVEARRLALESQPSSRVAAGSLQAFAQLPCRDEAPALRRAVKAIRARMGLSTDPP